MMEYSYVKKFFTVFYNMKKPYENYNKTYLTIAEGLSNCKVSLGQY